MTTRPRRYAPLIGGILVGISGFYLAGWADSLPDSLWWAFPTCFLGVATVFAGLVLIAFSFRPEDGL